MKSGGAAPHLNGVRRVLVVEDHPIVRKALADLLAGEPDLEPCGQADNAIDGFKQVEWSHPHLVVVDISLNECSGIELIRELRARHPDVKTLVWSMYDEMDFAERALRAGASGYVNKREPIERIVEAIRTVLRGEICLSPRMSNRLLCRLNKSGPLEEDPIHKLSDREFQIFELIGRGNTTKQIARELTLSPKTVEAHREKIKTKLGVDNSTELSRRAFQRMLTND